jgi:hypothetical protein
MSRSLAVAREERNAAKSRRAHAEQELERAQLEIQKLLGEMFRLGWSA